MALIREVGEGNEITSLVVAGDGGTVNFFERA
jgi:hypothetical protein